MYVARSFDINRPGCSPDKIQGGVIGGSLIQGKIHLGDEIEIKPGIQFKNKGKLEWNSLYSNVVGLVGGGEPAEEVGPGGLIGVATNLDPALTKADSLSGSVAGKPGSLPDILHQFTMKTHLLDRVVGTKEEKKVDPIRSSEPLMINIGTTTTIGVVTSARKNEVEVKLKLPVCAESGQRVALSRRVGARWRLIGYGIIS
jgi:translation initiation factor 2 subunit 3